MKAKKFEPSGLIQEVEDGLTVEAPLQISLQGETFSITMRTPGADEELVLGMMLTEGLIGTEGGVELSAPEPDQIEVHLGSELKESYGRRLAATSSCGICGLTDLTALTLDGHNLDRKAKVVLSQLPDYFGELRRRQMGFASTGGCHAAGAFSESGECLSFFEDIGRHNAVDKVIGDLLRKKKLSMPALLLVSGRVSFEIVAKCYRAKIPGVAAVSAVSTLAVETALEKKVGLIGFCRDGRATIYSQGAWDLV